MSGKPLGAFCHGRLHGPAVFRRDVRNLADLLRLNVRSIPLDHAAKKDLLERTFPCLTQIAVDGEKR